MKKSSYSGNGLVNAVSTNWERWMVILKPVKMDDVVLEFMTQSNCSLDLMPQLMEVLTGISSSITTEGRRVKRLMKELEVSIEVYPHFSGLSSIQTTLQLS